MRLASLVLSTALAASACMDKQRVMTVNGLVDGDKLGFTLPHEHVLVDFIGADSVTKSRYNQDSAYEAILPHLTAYKDAGGQALIECTPAYLGRDAALLKRLSGESGVTIITNTGYYGAAGEKFYPAHAFTETAGELSARWTKEWQEGIEGTGIRPGFMKLGSDRGPLTATQKKMVHAAAITHLATGLTIAIHSGDGAAAQEELALLEAHGLSPDALIWVHAQNENDSSVHYTMAQRGTWIEFDGLNDDNVPQYLSVLKYAKSKGFLNKVLISQDAGWYHVGEAYGGDFRAYGTLQSQLVPAMRLAGFTKEEIDLVTRKNPARAFAIGVRKR
jgi:predicted metal-dependent phosphotriesterase family hydrolase